MRFTLIGLIALLALSGCDAVHHPPRSAPVPPAPTTQSSASPSEDDSPPVTVESMQREIEQMRTSKPSTTVRTKEVYSYPPIEANVDITPVGVRIWSDFSFIDTQARSRRPEIQYYPETGGQLPVGNGGYVVIPAYVGGYTFDIIPNGTLGPIEVLLDGVCISRGTRFSIGNDRHNDVHRVEVKIGQIRQYRIRTYHDDGQRRVLMSQVDRDSTIWFPIRFKTYCKNGL